MEKQRWIVFFGPDGKELMRYTAAGTFADELVSTVLLLAHENGLQPEEITFAGIGG